LAAPLAAAFPTSCVDERRDLGQRRATLARELNVAWQHDGQVLLRLGHHAVFLAVQNGNRRAPVALARDAPVAEAIVHLRHAEPARDEPIDGPTFGLGAGQTVEEA